MPNLADATTIELKRWLARQAWCAGTRSSARGVLRAFYAWAVEAGYRPDNPASSLPAVRVPAAEPRPVPTETFAHAYAAANDRERLMLGLAGFAGLRRGEIASLPWSAIAGGSLRISGKGGRVRTVPLAPALAELLDAEQQRRLTGRYGSGWRYKPANAVYLFPGPSGQPVAPKTVGRVVGDCLGGHWSTHTLRHRFATLAYAAERDLFTVQRLLGHSSPTTTARYAAPPSGAAAAAVLASTFAALDATGAS